MHTGAAPAKYMEGREKKKQIEAVEKELHDAVAAEEYEKAATLRDKLRELKSDEGGMK